MKEIIQSIKGRGDVFFYCSPCTGGSTWQRLNLELDKRTGWEKTIVNLIDNWDFHWKLWERVEQVVRHCLADGATLLLEWPRFFLRLLAGGQSFIASHQYERSVPRF